MDDKELYQHVIDKLSMRFVKEEHFIDSNDFQICSLLDKADDEMCNEKKELIRSGIFDFFASKGFKAYIFFRTGNRAAIRLKLFDYDNNIYIDKLRLLFKDLRQHIKIKNENEKVYILKQAAIQEMINTLTIIKDDAVKKDVIRSATKQILELDSRDAIFFVGPELLIKIFTPSNDTKNRAAKRYYDSIPKEKLKKFDEFIKKSNMEVRVNNELKKRMANEFDFRRINNFQFGKAFIKTLQDMCIGIVGGFVKDDEYIIFGYANYLLRQVFDSVMMQLSTQLVDLILQKDRNAENFVKFYNGDVAFAPSGSKFKKPDIIDEYGQRWNFSTIFQLSMQRVKILEKIKDADEGSRKTMKSIEEMEQTRAESQKTIEEKTAQIQQVDDEFANADEDIKAIKENLQIKRTEAKKEKEPTRQYELKQEINTMSIELKKLTRLEDQNIANKKKLENEIDRLNIKVNICDKDIKAYEKKLENDMDKKNQLIENMQPIEEKYIHMLKALSKALSSFRGI